MSPDTAPGHTPLRLAVHLHLHYTDMWPEIQRYLSHLGAYPYHLYVTLSSPAPELIRTISEFHAQTTIFQVENRGYDVGPFIYFLHRIDLHDYDLILKLHSKNATPGTLTWLNHRCVNRTWWARLLWSSLLGSAERVRSNISLFEQLPQLGMIASRYLVTSHPRDREKVKSILPDVMGKLGFDHFPFRFVAGTMFMMRSCLLQRVKAAFRPEDFAPTDPSVTDGTLAHALERAFGCLTLAEGYELRGVAPSLRFELAALTTAIFQFLYKKKITKNNRLIIKICRIPLINKKLS